MAVLTWIVVLLALAAVIAYFWAWRKAPDSAEPLDQSLPTEPAVTFGTPFLEPTLTLGPTPEPPPAAREEPAEEMPQD